MPTRYETWTPGATAALDTIVAAGQYLFPATGTEQDCVNWTAAQLEAITDRFPEASDTATREAVVKAILRIDTI